MIYHTSILYIYLYVRDPLDTHTDTMTDTMTETITNRTKRTTIRALPPPRRSRHHIHARLETVRL